MPLSPRNEEIARRLATEHHRELRGWNSATGKRGLRGLLWDLDVNEEFHGEIIQRALVLATNPAPPSPAPAAEGRSGQRKPASRRDRVDENDISAPYRFIELSDDVVAPEFPEPIDLDTPLESGFFGTIEVEWIAESPLLVGGATSKAQKADTEIMPLRLGSKGDYVIPGATLRGLLRSATETIGYAKLAPSNWHYRFGLRNFEHPYYKVESGVSDVEKVETGFLHAPGPGSSNWTLTPASAKWQHVPIASLGPIVPSDTNLEVWKSLPLQKKYDLLGMTQGDTFDFTRTRGFSKSNTLRKDGREFSPDGNSSATGVLVVSDRVPGTRSNKTFEYVVFPAAPYAKAIPIPAHVVDLFLRLYSEPRKNRIEPIGSWKLLEKTARLASIPVFYIGDPAVDDGKFFFGLTRLFKIPHKLSIGDVVRSSQPRHDPSKSFRSRLLPGGAKVVLDYAPDFVEKLFGYVVEPGDLITDAALGSTDPGSVARKSRLAFGFARLDAATPAAPSDTVKVIQMAPRASFAPFYLRADGVKDYSGGKPKLAGRKAYFPRYQSPDAKGAIKHFQAFGQGQIELVETMSKKKISPDVLSHLRFLVPAVDRPLNFKGTIRFHNVTAAELGALLFALTHGGDVSKRFRHLVGRGKPFGAGQVRVGRVGLKVEANRGLSDLIAKPPMDEVFDGATGHGFCRPGDASLRPFLDEFATIMARQIRGYPDTPVVREWLGMADPEKAATQFARLVYRPLVSKENAFEGYRALRSATQAMETSDQPLPSARLLPAPKSNLPR